MDYIVAKSQTWWSTFTSQVASFFRVCCQLSPWLEVASLGPEPDVSQSFTYVQRLSSLYQGQCQVPSYCSRRPLVGFESVQYLSSACSLPSEHYTLNQEQCRHGHLAKTRVWAVSVMLSGCCWCSRLSLMCHLCKPQHLMPHHAQLPLWVWAASVSHSQSFLDHNNFHSRVKWAEASRAGVCAQLRLWCLLGLRAVWDTSQPPMWFQCALHELPMEQVNVHAFLMKRVQAFLRPPASPIARQPAKWTYLSFFGPLGWGTQYVAETTHSPGKMSTYTVSLFLQVLSQGNGSWTDGFCFLLAYGPFLQPWLCRKSFSQSLASFRWEFFYM